MGSSLRWMTRFFGAAQHCQQVGWLGGPGLTRSPMTYWFGPYPARQPEAALRRFWRTYVVRGLERSATPSEARRSSR